MCNLAIATRDDAAQRPGHVQKPRLQDRTMFWTILLPLASLLKDPIEILIALDFTHNVCWPADVLLAIGADKKWTSNLILL